jgi:chromosomal replication initiation ATPase DnaA
MESTYQPLKYTDRDIANVCQWAKTMTFDKIKQLLSYNLDGKDLTTQDIIYAASVVLNVPADKISSVGKTKDVIYAKQITRYIAYYYTRESGKIIASDVGNCCHANMFTGRKVIHDRLPFDWQLREHLRMVMGYLRSCNFKFDYKDRDVGVGYKANNGSFKKGCPSANPFGRPKGSKNKIIKT